MNEKIFSAICFLVLIDHHGGGYEKAHPNYIEEKLMMLNTGYDAYGFLDREEEMGHNAEGAQFPFAVGENCLRHYF